MRAPGTDKSPTPPARTVRAQPGSDGHRAHPGRRARRGALLLLIPAALLWAYGCGSSPAKSTIGREKFISTYVQLREAAARSAKVDSASLDSARAAILRRAGVTRQEMLAFADIHGRDVAFMKDVWDEVERRLDTNKHDSLNAH